MQQESLSSIISRRCLCAGALYSLRAYHKIVPGQLQEKVRMCCTIMSLRMVKRKLLCFFAAFFVVLQYICFICEIFRDEFYVTQEASYFLELKEFFFEGLESKVLKFVDAKFLLKSAVLYFVEASPEISSLSFLTVRNIAIKQ